MAITQSTYGWPLPEMKDAADNPQAFKDFGDAIAATIADTTLATYVPNWATVPGHAYPGNPTTQPFVGSNGSIRGEYTLKNKVCEFWAEIRFGSATYGAYGGLSISLPVQAQTGRTYQILPCSIQTPAAATTWSGIAYIDSGSTICRPHFPISQARPDMLPWSSTGGLYFNSAIPQSIAGNPGYASVQPGGGIWVQGRYRTL